MTAAIHTPRSYDTHIPERPRRFDETALDGPKILRKIHEQNQAAVDV